MPSKTRMHYGRHSPLQSLTVEGGCFIDACSLMRLPGRYALPTLSEVCYGNRIEECSCSVRIPVMVIA